VCCVSSGLWDELITHSVESYRVCVCVCVCGVWGVCVCGCVFDCVRFRSLKNSAALARVELMRHRIKYGYYYAYV